MNEFKNLNQTEMQVIRPNIFVMVYYWISQHLILVGIIVAILLSLCSCQKAAAEPISPYEIQYLEDMMQTWDTYPNNTPVDFTSLYSQFESDCNTYPYYVTNNSNYIIMCKKPSFGLVSVYNSSYNPCDVAFNVSDYPDWQDSFPFIVYQTYAPASDWRVVLRYEVYDFTGGMTVSPMRFSWTGNTSKTKTDYTRITYYNSTQFSVSNTSWYGNADSFYRCNGSNGTGYSNGWSVSQLSVTPIQIPYTEDSRLKFSTSLRGDGEKLLNTDLSGFVHWGPADNQDISDLVLTLDCDGTEVEVELDDTNSEIVNTKNPNYSKTLVYITPYSELGLDEYEDVTIVKCDFTHTDFNLMGTVVTDYHIACNYVLKNETAPIESEEIERDNNVDGDKLTQQDMDDVYYNIHFNDDADLDFDEFFDVEFPDGFSFYYVCLKNVAASWSDMIEDGFILPSDIYYLVTQTMPNKAALEEYIASWIKDNQAALFYDVVVFDYVQETNTTLTHTYYYYTTESGRIRAISNLLADIYQESNQTAVNTAAIYDYMYTRLNDFEDKSLESFNDMVALDRQRNTWLSTISSGVNTLNQTSLNGFADVVEAINGIDIPVPEPFDDSDILGGLSDILDKLDDLIDAVEGHSDNEDDTVSEAIAYYQAHNSNGMPTAQVFTDNKMSIWMAGKVHLWLQGSNASDTKTSLLSDAFDTLTSMYQAMSSEQYFFSGISGYLDDLTNSDYSSSDQTDPDKYYINFFFDPGYDPDRYDGGGIVIGE